MLNSALVFVCCFLTIISKRSIFFNALLTGFNGIIGFSLVCCAAVFLPSHNLMGFVSILCSLERKKTEKIRSPNFHVSKTRLVIYNLPKSMSEKQLKKLCIDAVTSRATKQKPMIRQVSLSFNQG